MERYAQLLEESMTAMRVNKWTNEFFHRHALARVCRASDMDEGSMKAFQLWDAHCMKRSPMSADAQEMQARAM